MATNRKGNDPWLSTATNSSAKAAKGIGYAQYDMSTIRARIPNVVKPTIAGIVPMAVAPTKDTRLSNSFPVLSGRSG